MGLHEEARPRRARVGEGAADVAEELALEERLGHGSTVDRHERPLLASAAAMEDAGDHLLAGPALAGHEHARVGVDHPVEKLSDPAHRTAVADELVEALRLPDQVPQALHLFAQRPMLNRARERDRERVHLDRFGDEVVRARADRGDRRLEASEGRDHDHRYIGSARHDALAEGEAVHATHVEVGEHDVHLRAFERREGGLRRGLRAHVVAARAETGGDRLAHLALVVDDEHTPAHDAASADSAEPGRKIVNRLPFPTSLSTSIQPPCSATIPCATARPSPVPSPIGLVV